MSADGFAEASRYYAEFRPALPDVLWRTLVGRLDCSESATLLDLGSGTGEVAVAIGGEFEQVVLVEPDSAMMSVAKARLSGVNEPAAEFVQCTAEEYQHGSRPAPCLVTISRAFHWMDQTEVLRCISAWGSEQTVVAILDDSSLWNCADAWAVEVRSLIQGHLGTERRAGSGRFSVPARSYEEVLRGEGYRSIRADSWTFVREWEPDDIEGYLYSTSYASRSLFGDQLAEFRDALHGLLNEHIRADGSLTEHARAQLITAHLPAK